VGSGPVPFAVSAGPLQKKFQAPRRKTRYRKKITNFVKSCGKFVMELKLDRCIRRMTTMSSWCPSGLPVWVPCCPEVVPIDQEVWILLWILLREIS
jgi:hypothetical protein